MLNPVQLLQDAKNMYTTNTFLHKAQNSYFKHVVFKNVQNSLIFLHFCL